MFRVNEYTKRQKIFRYISEELPGLFILDFENEVMIKILRIFISLNGRVSGGIKDLKNQLKKSLDKELV